MRLTQISLEYFPTYLTVFIFTCGSWNKYPYCLPYSSTKTLNNLTTHFLTSKKIESHILAATCATFLQFILWIYPTESPKMPLSWVPPGVYPKTESYMLGMLGIFLLPLFPNKILSKMMSQFKIILPCLTFTQISIPSPKFFEFQPTSIQR